jgi:hypothetical protein
VPALCLLFNYRPVMSLLNSNSNSMLSDRTAMSSLNNHHQ